MTPLLNLPPVTSGSDVWRLTSALTSAVASGPLRRHDGVRADIMTPSAVRDSVRYSVWRMWRRRQNSRDSVRNSVWRLL